MLGTMQDVIGARMVKCDKQNNAPSIMSMSYFKKPVNTLPSVANGTSMDLT